ncbi:hypothetical protein [Cellulophaga fucicola]|uniref:hypothetical protein n=1 Tax=Cellulophaga fucicola TaxID=76595 RepID=UPI003EBCD636
MDFLNPDKGNKWPGTAIVNWDRNKYNRRKPNVTGDNTIYNTHDTITENGIHNYIK